MGSLQIGLSGLLAQTKAMEVTAHNIANATNEGYSRQRAELGVRAPQSVSPGQLGRGVQLQSIISYRDALITEQLRSSQSALGRFNELERLLTETEMVFNEPNETGFSAVLSDLFSVLENLSNNADSVALRGATVQQLQTVTATVNSLATQLANQRSSLLQGAATQVGQVNALIDRMVGLNDSIRREVLVGRNPNDLLDQRDRVVRELSGYLDITTRINPQDQVMLVESRGRLLVGSDRGQHLAVETRDDDALMVTMAANGEALRLTNGALAGLEEMSQRILPQTIAAVDTIAVGLIGAFNAIHATGTSDQMAVNAWVGSTVFDSRYIGSNLDDAVHAINRDGTLGIPQPLLPVFTDGQGMSQPVQFTINVRDVGTGIAEKFVVQYDPGLDSVPAGRSLEDLVAAINSGRGGGFSVEPPHAGGIADVRASLVSTSDGISLKLQAAPGMAIDFSPALDVRPASAAWSGPEVRVSGGNVDWADRRVVFEVNNGNLEFYTLNPATGAKPAAPQSVPLDPPGVKSLLGLDIDVVGPDGDYVEGQTFAVDFDRFGNVIGNDTSGDHVQRNEWVTGTAGFTLKGRYEGNHAYDPQRPWRMEVLSGGTVGSASNAPVVSFTYYTGNDDARVEQTVEITLDDRYPPGAPVTIGEGVYAVFDVGELAVAEAPVEIVVDGSGDRAGLLPALGLNNLFSGHDARSLQVARDIVADPGRLAVSHSRAAGDNSNIALLTAVRERTDFAATGMSFDDYYQQAVADIAVRINQVKGLKSNQESVVASLENRRDAVAGVSIDEEVALLILQQQAYSAAARIISISRENIRTLFEAIG